MGRPETAESRSWEAKTFQASMLRAFAFLVPIVVSILTGVAAGAALPPPESRPGMVLWWVSVFVASTAGLIAADRLTRRLLPLATLLRLSMVFPDRAPSRVKLARRVTGSRAIANELEKAGKAGLEGDRQQAAETILALVGALGDYDSRTRGHSERTQLFVTMLADELKLKPEDKGKLMWAALVHDIGKLKVPHEVLNKPGKPDEDEWHILQSHPHQGSLICEPLRQWMGEWWLAIEQHHEKYDGSGYPRGLAGAQISYGARIVTVADSYEVMTASRPYKRPMTAAAAREELTRCSGAHFDPTVVRAFLNISLGRMHRSAGPIAWFAQLLAVRPGPILGQILGGAAAATGAAATAIGLQIAPSWSSPPPPQTVVTAPVVDESPEPDEQPKPDSAPTSNPTRRPQAPPVFYPPEPIVPIGVLPPPATEPEPEPEPLGPPTPEPGEPAKPGPSEPAEPEPSEPAKPEPNEPKPGTPNPPPVAPATRGDSLGVAEDSPGSVNVLANDEPGDAGSLTLVGASGAQHGSVSSSPSGTVTYTPALNYHGLDSVTYQARTPDGTVLTGSVAISVSPVNDAPVAVADSVTVDEDSSGTAVGVLANDVDVDGDLVQVTGVGTASHGSATLASGVVRYTPQANYTGPDSFTYTIADPDGLMSTATVTVTVSSGQDPPVAADDAMTIREDEPATAVSMLGNDSDPDGDPLTVTSVTGATNGVIAEPTPGSWTYKPNLNFHGNELLTYVVSDAKGGTASAKVSITVTAVNDPPVAVDDSFPPVTEDSGPTTLDLTLNDTDVDDTTLIVSAVGTPTQGGTVTLNAGVVSYQPKSNFSGAETFTYTVSDNAGGTDTGTVTMTVTAVNDPPVAVDDSLSTDEDTAISLTGLILANDYDPEGTPLTVTSVTITSATPHGVITEPTPGQWTYTPEEDYNSPPSETLSYTISDANGGTGTGTVTITVTPVDDPPVAVNDTLSTDEDVPLLLTQVGPQGVLDNDTDSDGSLTVTAMTITSSTPLGSVKEGPSGQWTYTPFEDVFGVESLSYTISDGLSTDSATVTLTINSVNDPPSAQPDAYAATLNQVVVTGPSVLGNDSDVEGHLPLTVTPGNVTAEPGSIALPVTFNADGTWGYAANTLGRHAYRYTVTDSLGASSVGELVITVSAAPTSSSSLFFQPGSPIEVTGAMTGTPAPPANPGPGPEDYDKDSELPDKLRPGLTIKSGGEKEGETDPAKFHEWLYTIPASGLTLNGLVSMTLWTSLENNTNQDLDYSGFLYVCDGAGAGCVKIAETVDMHVDNWNVIAGFEEQTVNIGSVSLSISAGQTLKLRVGFNHKDVWLAMDSARPSSLNLTIP